MIYITSDSNCISNLAGCIKEICGTEHPAPRTISDNLQTKTNRYAAAAHHLTFYRLSTLSTTPFFELTGYF